MQALLEQPGALDRPDERAGDAGEDQGRAGGGGQEGIAAIVAVIAASPNMPMDFPSLDNEN